MTLFSPTIPPQGPDHFKNELNRLAHPTFFKRYLVVEKDGQLKNAHFLRLFIEIIKGALGLRNGADETFVKYETLKYLLEGQTGIQADSVHLKLIKKVAERAGLTSLQKPSYNEEKDQEETNKLIHKINAQLIDFNKNEADVLLADFYIHYKEELTPFSKEIGNKILNLANQVFNQKTQSEDSKLIDSFEDKKTQEIAIQIFSPKTQLENSKILNPFEKKEPMENEELPLNTEGLTLKQKPIQEIKLKNFPQESTPNKLCSTAKKVAKLGFFIIFGTLAIVVVGTAFKAYSNLCPSYDILSGGVEAINHYKIAADQGNLCAQNNLGIAYADGLGIEQSDQEAVKYFTMAANQGHGDAQAKLGLMYVKGQGVEQNYEEAAKFYRRAANQGHVHAQYSLGFLYFTGQGVEQNYEEAAKFYRRAANQGHVDAQYNLGGMYANGQGVEQSGQEAIKYYTMAADQGDVDALYNVGVMYANGEGVEQNYQEAVKYYTMAADQGDVDALYNLGEAYANGQGVEQNDEKAVRYYIMAANQGHVKALYELGVMYANGRGVEKNDQESVKYLNMAKAQGHLPAQEMLKKYTF